MFRLLTENLGKDTGLEKKYIRTKEHTFVEADMKRIIVKP